MPGWAALTVEMHSLTVLEAGSPRRGQGWFPPRAVREGWAPDLSPWLGGHRLLPVSPHVVFSVSVCLCRDLPSFITPAILD